MQVLAPAPNLTKEVDRSYTVEEFLDVAPGIEEPVELVDGRIVQMGFNNWRHARTLNTIGLELNRGVDSSLGEIMAGDVGILIDGKNARAADLVYITAETFKRQDLNRAALNVAPELAVEIMSPGNEWEDVMMKVDEYLGIGVKEVWIVSPALRKVVRHLPAADAKTYAATDLLDASIITPGFEVLVGDLIPVSEPTAPEEPISD